MKKYIILSAVLIAAGVSTASADVSFGVSFGGQNRHSRPVQQSPRIFQGHVPLPQIAPSHGNDYRRPEQHEVLEQHRAPVVRREEHYAPRVNQHDAWGRTDRHY